jgi:hypothetical protein
MLESVAKQIGPGLLCPEFAGDCIDLGFVLIAVVSILGVIIGLAYYHKISRKKSALDTK